MFRTVPINFDELFNEQSKTVEEEKIDIFFKNKHIITYSHTSNMFLLIKSCGFIYTELI